MLEVSEDGSVAEGQPVSLAGQCIDPAVDRTF